MTLAAPALTLPWTDRASEELDVAIVGGGFSGMMTLVELLKSMPTARIALFERRQRPAPGVAYGACDAGHLLNVPAGRMGAFVDDVGGFHRWLEEREPGRYGAGDFVPRRLYGTYLVELVVDALDAAARDGRTRANLVRDAVVHMERLPTRVELLRASGVTCVARAVVLAPGLPQARAPWVASDQGVPRHLLATDPWDAHGYEGIARDAEVLVVGSGLTAVDVVLSLRRHGHRGRVVMVSRNGRLPLAHARPGEPVEQLDDAVVHGSPRDVLRALRDAARRRADAGLGWQAVLDALRPHSSAIWHRWSTADRTRFLRRLRPFWEIHRHRAPWEVLGQLESMRSAGTLELVRGTIASLDSNGADEARVTVRSPERGVLNLRVARVFNCVGPAMGVRDTVDPLLGSMLRTGLATCDDAGLGFRTDDRGHLRGADGQCDLRFVLVGALRRGELWESTAVPELRAQAKQAATEVAAFVTTPAKVGAGVADS